MLHFVEVIQCGIYRILLFTHCGYIQGVQDQNFRIQTAITQELCTRDHKLVKPKCV